MTSMDQFSQAFRNIRERTRQSRNASPTTGSVAPRGMFTLGDLVRHIAVGTFHLGRIGPRAQSKYVTHGRELADGKAAVLAFLDRMHEEATALFLALPPEAMDEKCPTPAGVELTTWKWLQMMTEHEIHHRGQIYLHLGMLQIPTPPLYGMTSEQVRRIAAS